MYSLDISDHDVGKVSMTGLHHTSSPFSATYILTFVFDVSFKNTCIDVQLYFICNIYRIKQGLASGSSGSHCTNVEKVEQFLLIGHGRNDLYYQILVSHNHCLAYSNEGIILTPDSLLCTYSQAAWTIKASFNL